MNKKRTNPSASKKRAKRKKKGRKEERKRKKISFGKDIEKREHLYTLELGENCFFPTIHRLLIHLLMIFWLGMCNLYLIMKQY
jgi:hypothetical protein